MDKYKKLVELIEMGAYESAYNLIEQLSKGIITKKNDFFYSLYILIQNGYGSKVTKLFDDIFYDSKNKDLKHLLNVAIKESTIYDSLDDNSRDFSEKCIEHIRLAFSEKNYFDIYDLCEMGFYLTGLPIFKYYEGKMFYKIGNYELCIETMNEYLKNGVSKSGKAYLYLSKSYFKVGSFKESFQCGEKVYMANTILETPYDYVALQDRGYDRKKTKNQFTLRMTLEDFYE